MTGYELVRSRRKTLSVQVTRVGRVIVRAPLRLAKHEIDRFVREHADWIAKALAHQRSLAEAHPEPDEAQARALAEVCGARNTAEGAALFRDHGAAPDRHPHHLCADAVRLVQREKQSVLFLAADGCTPRRRSITSSCMSWRTSFIKTTDRISGRSSGSTCRITSAAAHS